jgi:hypothetical protein
MVMPGFFSISAKPEHKSGDNYEVIAIGGEQFHAVAVALIDHLQSGGQVDEANLKKFLGRFYQYFPKYIDEQAYLTVTERVKRLIHNERKSELVECLAYTLRQLTVDRLYVDHLNLNYRDIFAPLSPQTPKSYLRDPHSQLPANALMALEHVLGIAIILSFKAPGLELRKLAGVARSGQSALTIQIQDEQYYPAVKRKNDFTYVGQLAVTVKPVVFPEEQEGILADIFADIAADDQRLLRIYEQQCNTILSMDAASELTLVDLLDNFTALYPYQDNNASYIIQLAAQQHALIANMPVEAQQQTKNLLAKKLASWIAAGAIKEDQLFDRIENTQSAVLAR